MICFLELGLINTCRQYTILANHNTQLVLFEIQIVDKADSGRFQILNLSIRTYRKSTLWKWNISIILFIIRFTTFDMMEKCIRSQISVNEQTGFSFSDDRILDIFQNNNALNETPKNLTPKNKVYNIILCKSQLDSSKKQRLMHRCRVHIL